jgi:site-specific DNA-methyltransferase (adenine-specific)
VKSSATESKVQVQCEFTEFLDLDVLHPHPKNRNSHPQDQIERLALLIENHGFRHPIILSKRSGFIVAGHGRVEAAKYLGIKYVPVDYQDFDSDEAEYAFLISDNAIASWSELDLGAINADIGELGPDFDIDLLGIRNFEIDVANKDPLCDEDDAPEPPNDPITKKGDVYKLGRHRMICGDSTQISDVEKLMGEERADMVWIDPPYNVNYEGKTKEALKIQNDEMSDETFYKFLYDAYTNLLMMTKPGGAIYVAHADSEGMNFRKAMTDAGWLLKQCLIWVKQSLVMGRQDYHWKHEPILYGWAPGAAHSWYADRKQTTVLEFNRPSKNTEHPTMKPVELIEYCLTNSSDRNDLILDLFGGSGSTMIAAEKSGRRAFLCELDPRYCDVIVARYEKYTGNKAERILSTDPNPEIGSEASEAGASYVSQEA